MENDSTKESVFEAARRTWAEGAPLRARRERMKRYTYGDQWSDPCLAPDGRVITEGDKAVMSGAMPITNNLMRQIVKSVVGRFRTLRAAERGDMDEALARVYRRNLLDELDARSLEEFLISGCAIQRVVSERRPSGAGPWVDNVSPAKFFVNRHSDPRGSDIELIGMIHEISLGELTMRFGRGDSQRVAEIARCYSAYPEPADDIFGRSAVSGRCRVVEVWTLEACEAVRCHDLENARAFVASPSAIGAIESLNRLRSSQRRRGVAWRRVPSVRWKGRFFTPSGLLLGEARTQAHGCHPFAVKLYPLIDGEVHPFVEDIVDTQRHINRLITLIDHIMGVSAKGALLFPMRAKHPEISWSEYASRWSQPGAVIPYRESSAGAVPTQLTATGANAGASDLLAIEMRLMEQISGVSSAMQGQKVEGLGGSAQLYNAQSDNAVTALRDIFDTFGAFTASRDAMLSAMIRRRSGRQKATVAHNAAVSD